jgi:WD40 repeat protein
VPKEEAMFFISHSTLDKKAALDLQERLRDRGYACEQQFLDSDQRSGIKLGEKWEKVIYDNLRDCRALIVLCSPNWLQSKWCFAELTSAKMTGKQIFPVVIADCDLSALDEYQAVFVNHENAEDRERSFNRLFQDLEAGGFGPKDHLPWPNPGLTDVNGQIDDCPFPGLPAFDERYAAVYFGRERETQLVLEELYRMRSNGEPRLLMIVGGSGSGKSSLLMAGVLPRLKHARSRSEWLVLPTLRFGRRDHDDALFESLADDILARYAAQAPPTGVIIPGRKTLRYQFASDDAPGAAKSFLDAVRDLSFACGCQDATALLPVDQFEEFLAPSAGARSVKFLKFLEQVCQHRNDRMLVVGTMRSDYLDIYERHPHALKAPKFHPWRLEPFPREQIGSVIVKPAERVHVEVAPDLLERLKQETPTTDALPLLAFTLEKLYRRYAADKKLDLTEYQDLGGMEGSIKHTAKEIMPANSLPAAVESAVRLSFVKHLVQVNDKGEFVRLTARWKDIDPVAHPILEKFVAQRLLIKTESNGEVTIEVAHEAMFRCWEQLEAWLRTSVDILRWRRDVRRSQEIAQTNRPKRTVLTGPQRVMARDWPRKRRAELSPDEIRWIKTANFKVRAWWTVAVIAFVLVSGLGAWAWTEKTKADAAAEKARFATQAAQGARVSAVAQVPGRATEALVTAIELVAPSTAKHRPVPPQAFHGLVDAIVAVGYSIPEQHTLLGHNGAVNSAVFSPDGTRIITAGEDHTIRLWEANSLKLIRTYERPDVYRMGGVTASTFSPDSKRVVIPASGNLAVVLDARQGEPLLPPLEHEHEVTFASFSADGTRIVTASQDGTARLWNAETGAVLQCFKDLGLVLFAALSPDGKYVASGGQRQKTLLWDSNNGEKPVREFGEGSWVTSGAFSPDSKMLLTTTEHGMTLWDLESREGSGLARTVSAMMSRVDDRAFSKRVFVMGPDVLELQSGEKPFELRHRFPAHSGNQVNSASISRDGRYVATTTTADRTARIWNAETGTLIAILEGHNASVSSCDFSPDGKRVVTASEDRTARLWDLVTDLSIVTVNDYLNGVTAVAVSPGGSAMVSCGHGVAYVHDMDGKQITTLQGDVVDISSRALTRDGTRIVASCSDHVARVFDAKSGAVVVELKEGHTGPVRSAAFSPDGTRILTASDDRTARVWDAGSGVSLHTLSGHSGAVQAAIFSPDGSKIATYSRKGDAALGNGTVFIWDDRGVQLSTLEGQVSGITSDPFSPDGSRIVAATEGNTARLWDARKGTVLQTLERQESAVKSARFSPNGGRIVTTYLDGSARLWDPATGQNIATLYGNPRFVYEAIFSPDGMSVITFSHYHSAQYHSALLWDSQTGELIAELGGISTGVNSVAFSADGTRAITAGDDGILRVYPASIDQFLDRARQMLLHRNVSGY